jgi:hypothetical protein
MATLAYADAGSLICVNPRDLWAYDMGSQISSRLRNGPAEEASPVP